jgi:hypothetical protein
MLARFPGDTGGERRGHVGRQRHHVGVGLAARWMLWP